MAITQVVSVWDCAMQAYPRPFTVPSTGMALRSFSDEVNNPESAIAKHPEDYELHHLASFDEESGIFIPLDGNVASVCLVRAKDLKVKTA